MPLSVDDVLDYVYYVCQVLVQIATFYVLYYVSSGKIRSKKIRYYFYVAIAFSIITEASVWVIMSVAEPGVLRYVIIFIWALTSTLTMACSLLLELEFLKAITTILGIPPLILTRLQIVTIAVWLVFQLPAAAVALPRNLAQKDLGASVNYGVYNVIIIGGQYIFLLYCLVYENWQAWTVTRALNKFLSTRKITDTRIEAENVALRQVRTLQFVIVSLDWFCFLIYVVVYAFFKSSNIQSLGTILFNLHLNFTAYMFHAITKVIFPKAKKHANGHKAQTPAPTRLETPQATMAHTVPIQLLTFHLVWFVSRGNIKSRKIRALFYFAIGLSMIGQLATWSLAWSPIDGTFRAVLVFVWAIGSTLSGLMSIYLEVEFLKVLRTIILLPKSLLSRLQICGILIWFVFQFTAASVALYRNILIHSGMDFTRLNWIVTFGQIVFLATCLVYENWQAWIVIKRLELYVQERGETNEESIRKVKRSQMLLVILDWTCTTVYVFVYLFYRESSLQYFATLLLFLHLNIVGYMFHAITDLVLPKKKRKQESQKIVTQGDTVAL
ncbi:hypothetical protein EDD86DRAFT_246114 [Gorgonomyces haynaldii]|nr:hypothetical protein EDD86DRAFT_246114 [Gorgonomyces haynaldii]